MLAGVAGVAVFGEKALYGKVKRAWARLTTSDEVLVASEFQSAFPDLDLSRETCVEFVRRYREVYKKLPETPVTGIDKRRLLLSTNFVQERGDPKAGLRFVAFYDPYVSPCYNPFTTV